MKTINCLSSQRRTSPGTIGKQTTAVTDDDFYSLVLLEPSFNAVSIAIRQDLHWLFSKE